MVSTIREAIANTAACPAVASPAAGIKVIIDASRTPTPAGAARTR
jgi:hypothetical protein